MVTFRDNNKGKIIGIGNIDITPSKSIENILLIDGLKHNLLSISRLCDKGFKVIFKSFVCIVASPNDDGMRFIGYRYNDIYIIDLDDLFMQICNA